MPAPSLAASHSPRRAFFAKLCILGIVFAAVGCSGETARNTPAPGVPSEAEIAAAAAKWEIKPPKDGKPSFWVQAPKDDAPVVKISAAEFGDELKTQGEALLEKYRGKWLEITGKVDSLSPLNREGEAQLTMPGQDLKEGYTSIDLDFKKFLVFNTAEPALWKKTSRGAVVTMRGVLARISGAAGFDHGTIVSTDGPPASELEAAEMAQDYVKDPKECETKYAGKGLVVRGEFQEYEKYNDLPVLKGDGKVGIVLHFFGTNPDFQDLKPGDSLVVYGVCEVNTSEVGDRKIILNSAFRIKEESPSK